MKPLLLFAGFLLASCSAAPPGDRTIIITNTFFKNDSVKYTGQHDIVKIFVPLTQFNFEDVFGDITEETEPAVTMFFVEADVTNSGKKDQGLYLLKDNKTKKLLDNGRDAAATHENAVYFGAKDGIYKFNESDNTAVKHGRVTKDIVQMAHNNKTNDVYYLTANHEVHKLKNNAISCDIIPEVTNVTAIVFGFEGNMYYTDTNKDVYVYDDRVESSVPKKVEGLPAGFENITLVSPIYGLEEGAILVVDNDVYLVNSHATVRKSFVKFEVQPTAFAPQPCVVQYYAINKSIYEVNVIAHMLSGMLGDLQSYLDSNIRSTNSTESNVRS